MYARLISVRHRKLQYVTRRLWTERPLAPPQIRSVVRACGICHPPERKAASTRAGCGGVIAISGNLPPLGLGGALRWAAPPAEHKGAWSLRARARACEHAPVMATL